MRRWSKIAPQSTSHCSTIRGAPNFISTASLHSDTSFTLMSEPHPHGSPRPDRPARNLHQSLLIAITIPNAAAVVLTSTDEYPSCRPDSARSILLGIRALRAGQRPVRLRCELSAVRSSTVCSIRTGELANCHLFMRQQLAPTTRNNCDRHCRSR
jgi:hypothetical protein